MINESRGATFSKSFRLRIEVFGTWQRDRLTGADIVPQQIELEELIAYLHEELGHIDQAIQTLERMAAARAARPMRITGRVTRPRVARVRSARKRASHRARIG